MHTPWTTDTEITLHAIDTSEFAPTPDAELLKVHAWSVPCIDDVEEHNRGLRNRTGNVSRRKAFLRREGLTCYGPCLRGVVDGFATHAEIDAMIEIAPVPLEGQHSHIHSAPCDASAMPVACSSEACAAKSAAAARDAGPSSPRNGGVAPHDGQMSSPSSLPRSSEPHTHPSQHAQPHGSKQTVQLASPQREPGGRDTPSAASRAAAKRSCTTYSTA